MAKLFYEFIKYPRLGEVYNVGGGRKNSISLLETIDLIEKITGKRIKYDLGHLEKEIIFGGLLILAKLGHIILTGILG